MPGFLKHYADAGRAQEALRRTLALRQQGLPTPMAGQGPSPETLRFQRIEGQTARDLIGVALTPLLHAIRRLHAAQMNGLPAYDPLLRIRPRLALTDNPHLKRLAEGPVPTGRALLHGDLHVGQFIREPSGKIWLIDLDDLAIGPPEADIANFAAHLATTDPRVGIAEWATHVCGAWVSVGGSVAPSVFTRFLHLALLRRHLKLRAAGRPDFEAEICAYLRDSSSFSMR